MEQEKVVHKPVYQNFRAHFSIGLYCSSGGCSTKNTEAAGEGSISMVQLNSNQNRITQPIISLVVLQPIQKTKPVTN